MDKNIGTEKRSNSLVSFSAIKNPSCSATSLQLKRQFPERLKGIISVLKYLNLLSSLFQWSIIFVLKFFTRKRKTPFAVHLPPSKSMSVAWQVKDIKITFEQGAFVASFLREFAMFFNKAPLAFILFFLVAAVLFFCFLSYFYLWMCCRKRYRLKEQRRTESSEKKTNEERFHELTKSDICDEESGKDSRKFYPIVFHNKTQETAELRLL